MTLPRGPRARPVELGGPGGPIANAAPPPPARANSRALPRVPQEHYGEHLSVLEILQRIDHDWLACAGQTLPFLRKCGKEWAIERHALNDRGDASSILARKQSVERIGVVNAARSGARGAGLECRGRHGDS
eukprot:4932623-Pyramimonas_sp.AAC.1